MTTHHTSDEQPGYVPGVCNIGPAERQHRRQLGLISGAAAIVFLVIMLATHAPRPWRLLLFVPIAGAASGLLQDRMHFCAGFGMRGVANVFNPVGETEDVVTAEFRKQDKRKALQIFGLSAGIGAILTAVACVI